MPKTLGFDKVNRFSTIEGRLELIDSKIDQHVLRSSDVQFNSIDVTTNVIIRGNLDVQGVHSIFNVDIVNIKDNILLINSTETGAGVTAGLSGIEIKRGTLDNYQSVFEESTEFFKIGKIGQLQAVATREDNPLANGIIVYNNTLKRFDSVNNIIIDTIFSSGTNSTSSNNGALSIVGGLGISADQRLDGKLYLKGNIYGNYLTSNNLNNLILFGLNDIDLSVSSGKNINIPNNVLLTFNGTTQNINTSGTNLNIVASDNINLTPGTSKNVVIPVNNKLQFGSNTLLNGTIVYDGTDLNIASSGNLNVSPVLHITNTINSVSSTIGGIVSEGGIAINNSTNSVSSLNGGALTINGGVGINKNTFIGGVLTLENSTNSSALNNGALVVNGGIAVNKTVNTTKLSISNNLSGANTDGAHIISGNSTYINSVSPNSSNLNNFSFNAFAKSTLSATNTNITTTNASTVYIQDSPLAGINQTITNAYSLWIASGIVRIDSDTLFNSNSLSSVSFLGGINLYKRLSIGTNQNYTPDLSGVYINNVNSIINDSITSSNGTVTEVNLNYIGQSTLTATNTNITTTSASSFTIEGPPIANTNQTITNVYSLRIKSGKLRLEDTTASTSITAGTLLTNGGISINNTTNAVSVTNGGTITSGGGASFAKDIYIGGISNFINTIDSSDLNTAAIVLNGGISVKKSLNIGNRLIISNDYSGTPTDGLHTFIGNSIFTDSVTSSNGTISNISFNILRRSTINATNTNITTTNASTFYIQGAPITGTNETITNSYALWIADGITRIDGNCRFTSTLDSSSSITGASTFSGGVGINKNLFVNGTSDLQNVNISTNNGGLIVTGTNQFNFNVTNSSTIQCNNDLNLISSTDINLTSINTDITSNFIVNNSNGNIFSIIQNVPSVNVINPIENINNKSILNFNGGGGVNSYSQIVNTIKSITSGSLTSTLELNLIQGSILQNYIKLDSDLLLTTLNSATLLTNTDDAISVSSGGALTINGGIAISKKLFAGGIVTFTNSTSSSNSNTGALVLSNGGLSINNSSNATSNTSGGACTIAGGLSVFKDTYINGILNITNTTSSSSSTAAAIVSQGGISVNNNVNATSVSNGGSLTVRGGGAFSQDVYIGGNLNVNGNVTYGINTPTITTSNLTNIDSITIAYSKSIRNGNEIELSITFVLTMTNSIIGDYSLFEFNIPNISTNFANQYSLCIISQGNHSTVSIENISSYSVISTTRCSIRLTAGSNNEHIIHSHIRYTSN